MDITIVIEGKTYAGVLALVEPEVKVETVDSTKTDSNDTNAEGTGEGTGTEAGK